jgi:hypothetical protein
MELSPYNAPAGDQLTDWRLFEPLHPTMPKQYGTKKLMHTPVCFYFGLVFQKKTYKRNGSPT